MHVRKTDRNEAERDCRNDQLLPRGTVWYKNQFIQSGPAKNPAHTQYRDAPSNFMSWDLKFWHAIWSSLADVTKAALFFSLFFCKLRCGVRFRRNLYGGREPSNNVKSKKSFFGCLHEIVPNHVSKFQGSTHEIAWRIAKFQPKCHCIPIYIYFRDPSITFERKWPMKWTAYLPTPRPKMYMPIKIKPIPSTLYCEKF